MSLRKLKAVAAFAGAALILTGVSACSQERDPETDTGTDTEETTEADAPEDVLVGIAMPTRSLERWNKDGSNLDSLLRDLGYETTLQYADNEVDQQISQIQNMVNDGADVLVVASIDGTALAPDRKSVV